MAGLTHEGREGRCQEGPWNLLEREAEILAVEWQRWNYLVTDKYNIYNVVLCRSHERPAEEPRDKGESAYTKKGTGA